MGLMIDGQYLAEDPPPDSNDDGRFRRQKATIRNWIGKGEFPADLGRYHLYAAWNCPWAHRVLLTLAIKNIEMDVSFARPRRTEQGWVFDTTGPYSDARYGIASLHELYGRTQPSYTGRITVPLVWDTVSDQAVSNESADIIRMLNPFGDGPDLCPPEAVERIERWNDRIYRTVNNGVYRAGFARTQEAYEEAVEEVFETLQAIETQLCETPYLCGEHLTEADVRLFPTLARFDVAYHYAFRCNRYRIQDYPYLWEYARQFYARPGVAETVKFDLYKQGYFSPSELRNPFGIVPLGPMVDWSLT